MTQLIGRTQNTSDIAVVSDFVEVTTNSAVLAVPANERRVFLAITILDDDAYIRFMPASADSISRKGIYINKDLTYEMPPDNIYTGEISIINTKNNQNPLFSFTEF